MTSTRLFAVTLMLCSPLVFGQKNQGNLSRPGSHVPAMNAQLGERSGQLDPTKPVLDQLSNRQVDTRALDALIGRFVASLPVDREPVVVKVSHDGEFAELPDDPVCYSIRSYVVARDCKDSDSTHPVSESTCQPAPRYGLRTSDLRTASQDR